MRTNGKQRIPYEARVAFQSQQGTLTRDKLAEAMRRLDVLRAKLSRLCEQSLAWPKMDPLPSPGFTAHHLNEMRVIRERISTLSAVPEIHDAIVRRERRAAS